MWGLFFTNANAQIELIGVGDKDKVEQKKRDLEILAERAIAFNEDQEEKQEEIYQEAAVEAFSLVNQYEQCSRHSPYIDTRNPINLQNDEIYLMYDQPLADKLIVLNQETKESLAKYEKLDSNSKYQNLFIKEVDVI